METRASRRKKRTRNAQFPSTSNQDSSSIIPSLPQEIGVEILSKLPVKSLLQFRSVSKSWLSLISSSEFIKTHLRSCSNNKEYNHHRSILNFICNLKDFPLHSLIFNPITEASEMDYPMKNSLTRWCDTANGLICLANKEKSDKPMRMTNKLPSSGVNLYIWNPSIRKSRKLPDSGVKSKWFCSTYFRYGFGYDELHDDYKLMVIFNIFDDNHRDDYASIETKVKIYSLKSDSWRTVEDFEGSSLIDCSAKFVKGKLYWTKSARARKHNSYYGCTIIHFYEYDDGNSCNIISFDLAHETWGKVEQPNYGKGKFDLMLGVLGSDLAVLCNYEGSHSDVWVMKDYGVKASWTKMFTVSCPNDPGKYDCYPRCSLSFSPLFCQLYNGEVLLLYRSVFMIYNPKDDSIRVIRQPEVTKPKSCFQAEIYVESLVNPC